MAQGDMQFMIELVDSKNKASKSPICQSKNVFACGKLIAWQKRLAGLLACLLTGAKMIFDILSFARLDCSNMHSNGNDIGKQFHIIFGPQFSYQTMLSDDFDR